MADWNDIEARQRATRRFCELLDADDELRERCKSDSGAARDALQKAGDFTEMPADLEVRVFERERGERDQLVTMVLPARGKVPPEHTFDAREVWQCTYLPYKQ
jgi:hypothetical protein